MAAMTGPMTDRPVLVFDSGIGGLTVLREARVLMPGRRFAYVADDAAFPYGAWEEETLRGHILTLFAGLLERFDPEISVIACNTASTLALPPLRARWPDIAFVGTVPAIKPAAAMTRSGLISVLATPGTVSRDYTQDLIRDFAAGVEVTLVGSKALAGLAERALRGEGIDPAAIASEIAPCFVEGKAFASQGVPGSREAKASDANPRRTDVIVLACTHYPLLIDRLRDLAPWPVEWIDPAPAIARRVVQVSGERRSDGEGCTAVRFTAGDRPDLSAFNL